MMDNCNAKRPYKQGSVKNLTNGSFFNCPFYRVHFTNTEGLTLFDCQSPSCSIKNAVIDADGKRLHSVIYIDASPIIDNVQFIGMDRTKYAITATTKFCTPTISNCSFSSTEQAGIFSYWFENSLPNVTIENCTFDGAGEPGYAILIQSGEATISNCVIKGYQGKLVTGWNSANDTVFDYNPYKGLHDGFSSAGIFIRDDGQAVLHGNSISNCDSGIKIWTGEGFIYNHEVSNAQGGFNDVLTGPITVYTTVNGTEIKDADTANLKLDNTDTDVNGLDICSAADPDNPVPLYQGTLTGGQTAATYAVSGTITDASSGAAIQGATIDAGNGNTTTSGTDGSYSLYLANGTYTLTVSNTGYQTGTITIIVNGAAVTSKNLSLTLTSTAPATYAVSGVISNASGALAGATVATGSNIATTGLDGTYTLNLPTGDYTLNVSEIGYQSGTISITVKGAELSNQNLTLSPAASNDANLATVAGQAITAGGQAGTKGAPKLASISVANGIATVAAADIVKTDAGATVAFYGTDSTFTNTTSSAINLSAGALTVIYIKVTTADTTTLYYSVTINRAAAASSVTATPAINGTPTAGDTSVSGTAVSGASISLSISGTAYTGTADGTGAWSITVPALVSGNTITVTALAAGDTVSAQTTATVQAGSSTTGIYTITPTTDSAYYLNSKTNGIDTITVNSGVSGLKYFTANITTITPHTGGEKVIFEQLRGGAQINLNATGADFNTVNSATAGFNVQAHDVIKVYIVDDLTNATNFNPTVLEQ
ncbi:hypothetical protein SBF1_4480003 [Candidatus Desulfosporosinus infrequens]|uniref:Right handed beta helix domain-containing protein n=1 Tax=Candidatus Desulfosporosinus infrequens TaxID=2043169 RepID=A0A2U3LBK1_9FIRM|nr:hypothetical protein SBF1_4480003 [Candidatus Desulfosporosinus infrequens]